MRLSRTGLAVLALGALLSHEASSQSTALDSGAVSKLPLVELPSADSGQTLVVFLSGDGGWADIDKRIARRLASRGLSVIGFSMRDYLKQQRTPDEVSRAVAGILREYERRWHRRRVAIVGFSRGANLAPFAASRLPQDLREQLALVALIGLNRAANFKWHFQDVFRDVQRDDDVPTLPEIEKLSAIPMLCIYGQDEKESGCRSTPDNVRRVERAGGHHLDGDYDAVGDLIADAIQR